MTFATFGLQKRRQFLPFLNCGVWHPNFCYEYSGEFKSQLKQSRVVHDFGMKQCKTDIFSIVWPPKQRNSSPHDHQTATHKLLPTRVHGKEVGPKPALVHLFGLGFLKKIHRAELRFRFAIKSESR